MRFELLLMLAAGFASKWACEAYCPAQFDGVAYCYDDGQIFPNACAASCKRDPGLLEFECLLSADVTLNICSNRCQRNSNARMNSVFRNSKCDCPRVFSPVCGSHDLTYFNDCFRQCNGADLVRDGYCKETAQIQCKTGLLFEPVCGHNGITYANAELAACAKSSIAYSGPCVLAK